MFYWRRISALLSHGALSSDSAYSCSPAIKVTRSIVAGAPLMTSVRFVRGRIRRHQAPGVGAAGGARKYLSGSRHTCSASSATPRLIHSTTTSSSSSTDVVGRMDEKTRRYRVSPHSTSCPTTDADNTCRRWSPKNLDNPLH